MWTSGSGIFREREGQCKGPGAEACWECSQRTARKLSNWSRVNEMGWIIGIVSEINGWVCLSYRVLWIVRVLVLLTRTFVESVAAF